MPDGGLVFYFGGLIVLALFFLVIFAVSYSNDGKYWIKIGGFAFVFIMAWITFSGAYLSYFTGKTVHAVIEQHQ